MRLRYDDDKDPEIAVGARFECNRLITDDLKRFPTPIVGRWTGGYGGPGPNAWEFHRDGTFLAERIQQRFAGSFTKAKDAVPLDHARRPNHGVQAPDSI